MILDSGFIDKHIKGNNTIFRSFIFRYGTHIDTIKSLLYSFHISRYGTHTNDKMLATHCGQQYNTINERNNMKTTMTLLAISLASTLQAGELEKEIQYIDNDGTTETHKIICQDGRSGIVSIDLATREMSVEGENLGRVTFAVVVEKICR